MMMNSQTTLVFCHRKLISKINLPQQNPHCLYPWRFSHLPWEFLEFRCFVILETHVIFFNIYSIKNSYIISMIYNSSLQSCLSTHIPLKTIKICTQGIGLTCFSHGKGCTWSLKGHYCIYPFPFQVSINFIVESTGHPSCRLRGSIFQS